MILKSNVVASLAFWRSSRHTSGSSCSWSRAKCYRQSWCIFKLTGSLLNLYNWFQWCEENGGISGKVWMNFWHLFYTFWRLTCDWSKWTFIIINRHLIYVEMHVPIKTVCWIGSGLSISTVSAVVLQRSEVGITFECASQQENPNDVLTQRYQTSPDSWTELNQTRNVLRMTD